MTALETWELLSYVVTVIGLPFAIAIFLWEQRKERLTEEEELHLRLNGAYSDFLRLVLDHADLKLLHPAPQAEADLTDEQRERRFVLFGILISIFEQAYVMVYDVGMNRQRKRLWQDWADYMEDWCRRGDFRAALPELLRGEDPEFADYMRRVAARADASGHGR
ncbi:MAG: hypothetical protein MUC79_04840 [Thiobacillaceae bacterium]|jgi:hypothetical protein|nr:hypothetical protein [Thiobacillaceae bacterium]